MARFPPSALAALLAAVSSTSSSSGGEHSPFVGASAYISTPTNFPNHHPASQSQRRNSLHLTELAASRPGGPSSSSSSSSSTFRPLFDDANRLSPLDGSRGRIPQTGSTGGAVSLDQSAANRRRDENGRNRGNGNARRAGPYGEDMDDEFARKERPGRSSRGPPKKKKKSPLWGMFHGNGDTDKGGNTRRKVSEQDSPERMPERVRLSDIGKDVEPTTSNNNGPMNRNDANEINERGNNGPRNSAGKKQVWGGRYGSGGPSNSTTLTDSSYFGPRGGPGGPGGPYGPPPDGFLYDDDELRMMEVEEERERRMMYEQQQQQQQRMDMEGRGDRDRMDGRGPGGGPRSGGPGSAGGGGGVDAYGRPNRGAGRMNAPPMEAPPQQGMKNKGGGSGGGGGRPPSGGGRREPNLFDKVSNFVADSGTIAVLKTEIGFLEREIKSRKQKFGVDAYDAIDQLEYEHETFLRRLEEEGRGNDQDAIDADLDRMEGDKEFRIRRLYENARRDIVGFEREIGYKEEEIMDIEAAETEKQDAAWDEYRRPGDGGGGGGGRGAGTAPSINVGRKDKYVRVPNDPNAMSNKQPPPNQDPYGRAQQPQSQSQPQGQAQMPKKSVRLSDIGKEKNDGFDDFSRSTPLEGRGTRPQQQRPQQSRGRISDVGKERQTLDEIFDNLDRRQGERRQRGDQQQRQEDFDRRFDDEFDDMMPPPPPRSSGFQQPPPQQGREPIVPPPPRQEDERQPIIPPPPQSSASNQQQRPGQPMNAPMDVGRDAEWDAPPSNGPQSGADPYGRNSDELDRYGRKPARGSGEWKRGDEWEPPRFQDGGADRKVY